MLKRNFRLDRSVEWAPLEISCTVSEIELIAGRQVVYGISHRGFRIPVFAYLSPGSRQLIACGQDAVARDITVLPLFHRWSWHTKLRASFLVFNDPTLYLHDQLGTGWSQGRADAFAIDAMADVLRRFCELLRVPASDALLFGTSAGGFWALMTGAELSSRQVIVDIPQVDLFSYHDRAARDAMLRACFPGSSEDAIRQRFSDRLRVIDRFRRLQRSPRHVLYLQNTRDVKHVRTQMTPFQSELELLRAQMPEAAPDVRFRMYDRIGEGGRGHIQMESDETVSVLNDCLECAA